MKNSQIVVAVALALVMGLGSSLRAQTPSVGSAVPPLPASSQAVATQPVARQPVPSPPVASPPAGSPAGATAAALLPDEVPEHVIAETAPDIQPASDVLSVDLGDLPVEEGDLATEAASLLLGASESPSEPARRQKKPARPRGEKAPALEPVLLLGAEEELQALARQEAEKSVTLEGYLKIEEQPISRRAAVRRWVLETASGTRIPLQLTLAFITELKKDGIFDQPVRLTGVWRPSPGNERLRFFAADRIEPRPEPEEGGVASAPLLASGPMTAPGPAGASATAFVAYEDELAAGASPPRPATALASPAPSLTSPAPPLASPAAALSRHSEDPGPVDPPAPASLPAKATPRVP